MASPSSKPPGLGGPLVGLAAALFGGLAAGAGAAHILHRKGHKVGMDLRRYRPAPAEPEPPKPEDYEAREPGRGRIAERPRHIPRKGWTDILWRTGASYFGDRVGFVSGGVTFFMLLALFPTLAAFVTVYGLFADPENAWSRLRFLYSVLPPGVAEFIGGEMQRLAEDSRPRLTLTLIGTLALSLWLANNGIKTLFYGLNVAYHEIERRNIVTYNLLCMGFTLAGLGALLFTAVLVVGVPIVLGPLGLMGHLQPLAPLRWLVLYAVYIVALTLIYRHGPCRTRAHWHWLTPGAIVAATLSLALSAVFSWYLQNFVRTDSFGPLAAMMGFLLWTWLTVQIILMGAELNAEIEHQTAVDTTVGPPVPLGERGAVVADSVGAKRGSPAALTFTLKHAEAISDRLLRRRNRKRARKK